MKNRYVVTVSVPKGSGLKPQEIILAAFEKRGFAAKAIRAVRGIQDDVYITITATEAEVMRMSSNDMWLRQRGSRDVSPRAEELIISALREEGIEATVRRAVQWSLQSNVHQVLTREQLKELIGSIPDSRKEIKEAAEEDFRKQSGSDTAYDRRGGFIAGAEWAMNKKR